MCGAPGLRSRLYFGIRVFALFFGGLCPLQKARELVCRVQLLSARGDLPAARSGTFEICAQHPSVVLVERLRAREKARLTGGPGGPCHPTAQTLGGVDILGVLASRPALLSAR